MKDFKEAVIKYLEALMENQQQVSAVVRLPEPAQQAVCAEQAVPGFFQYLTARELGRAENSGGQKLKKLAALFT